MHQNFSKYNQLFPPINISDFVAVSRFENVERYLPLLYTSFIHFIRFPAGSDVNKSRTHRTALRENSFSQRRLSLGAGVSHFPISDRVHKRRNLLYRVLLTRFPGFVSFRFANLHQLRVVIPFLLSSIHDRLVAGQRNRYISRRETVSFPLRSSFVRK